MSDFKMFFRILSDSNVTYTRVSGDLLLTEMLKELHKLIQHPSFNPNTNYFHDFREVDKIVGSLPEHERLADFAISVASDEALNVIFVIQDNNPSVQKYLEGYALMASSSNRNYRIFLNSEINKALDILGLSAVPEIEGLDS